MNLLTSLTLFAQTTTEQVFQWGRIQTNTDWVLPIAATVAAGVYVMVMYRRDAVDLPFWLAWPLTILRTVVFLGLLFLYLQPQWRIETEWTEDSQVLVMVDSSLSMGMTDVDAPVGTITPADTLDGNDETSDESPSDNPSPIGAKRLSRIEQVTEALAESRLLGKLLQQHDVILMPFGEALSTEREVNLTKNHKKDEDDAAETAASGSSDETNDSKQNGTKEEVAPQGRELPIDLNELFLPTDTATSLGRSLREAVEEFRASPISGILLISDGGQNGTGTSPAVAARLAKEAGIPVHTVAIGSDKLPKNVRVSDLACPTRTYPGDSFAVTGYLQGSRMAGEVVDVELLARDTVAGDTTSVGTGQLLETRQVTLGADGEVRPVRFEVAADRTGRRTLCLRVRPPADDADKTDDYQEADVETVKRENRVMLIAGGPMRDYRFLRTQLFRDRSVTLDVYLQSALPGISQEADNILDTFPETTKELYQYDCIVAFDPDWQALTVDQVDMLESWVAEQGGGMIVIAGPVYTSKMGNGWLEDPTMAKVRALYPVEFQRQISDLGKGVYTADEPWPIDFTRDGMEAEYLWPADTAIESRQAWNDFPGIYSFRPVSGAKAGAKILARYSDPRTSDGDEQPIYMAEQFYGSGRVLYIGSAEMWRVRAVDPNHFVQVYTKMIRHVSQGRLLRGSSRGVLLVGQTRYVLGSSVEVRAQLTNAQMKPLEAPDVLLEVIRPDGSLQSVVMTADPSRVGTFTGRFNVLSPGTYQLELPVPESADVRLTQRIRVRIPDLERENPQRNDRLMGQVATITGGMSYIGADALVGPLVDDAAKHFVGKTRVFQQTKVPDFWKQDWLKMAMFILCGLLFIEWTVRRLAKLA